MQPAETGQLDTLALIFSAVVALLIVAGGVTLVINYNYDAFWQVVSGGGQTFNHQGLLGVSIPIGSQELVLAYQSPRLTAGLLLAAAVLAVAAWTTLRR